MLCQMLISQYANRQPIGLEKVIKNVTASRVKDFYHRWYRPEHMAIVAVGDFPNTEVRIRIQ
jgi:zinc protease